MTKIDPWSRIPPTPPWKPGKELTDEELAHMAATTRWAPCVRYADGKRDLPQLFGFHDKNAAHAAARAAAEADPQAIGSWASRKEGHPYDAAAAQQMLDVIASVERQEAGKRRAGAGA